MLNPIQAIHEPLGTKRFEVRRLGAAFAVNRTDTNGFVEGAEDARNQTESTNEQNLN
jgi:hypothetical protein